MNGLIGKLNKVVLYEKGSFNREQGKPWVKENHAETKEKLSGLIKVVVG